MFNIRKDARKLICEVTLGSKVFERLDRSHQYFEIFQAKTKTLKNK